MQTFLAYEDFNESAKVLDPKRLGNQAYREGMILLRGGWSNHPASKMWNGYKRYLAEYLLACFRELSKRGRDYPHHVLEINKMLKDLLDNGKPPWLGNENLHSSHRSNLLRKDPVWYGKFGWTEPNNLPYYWPSKERITQ